MNTISKVIDTLTGKSLKEAAEENSKTAADLSAAAKEARLRKERERLDAEAIAKDAEERKATKGG